jgi:gliding motility-associated-like protein
LVADQTENVEINNFMSPNGDGKNDVWEIKGDRVFSACDVKIINRFGNTVYQSKGYDNTWDGTSNGKELPAGVYYYVISCSGKAPVTGDITLMR